MAGGLGAAFSAFSASLSLSLSLSSLASFASLISAFSSLSSPSPSAEAASSIFSSSTSFSAPASSLTSTLDGFSATTATPSHPASPNTTAPSKTSLHPTCPPTPLQVNAMKRDVALTLRPLRVRVRPSGKGILSSGSNGPSRLWTLPSVWAAVRANGLRLGFLASLASPASSSSSFTALLVSSSWSSWSSSSLSLSPSAFSSVPDSSFDRFLLTPLLAPPSSPFSSSLFPVFSLSLSFSSFGGRRGLNNPGNTIKYRPFCFRPADLASFTSAPEHRLNASPGLNGTISGSSAFFFSSSLLDAAEEGSFALAGVPLFSSSVRGSSSFNAASTMSIMSASSFLSLPSFPSLPPSSSSFFFFFFAWSANFASADSGFLATCKSRRGSGGRIDEAGHPDGKGGARFSGSSATPRLLGLFLRSFFLVAFEVASFLAGAFLMSAFPLAGFFAAGADLLFFAAEAPPFFFAGAFFFDGVV
mmetsp:Transcript_36160/g.108237  ORF Transcript_36160/g.108237 Transcript_36160/m.108237 type:complete len:473 (-) Transcript_36160:339-1757(-)